MSKNISLWIVGIVVCSMLIYGVVVISKDLINTQNVNLDYVEEHGLEVTKGSIYNSGFGSEYLDLYSRELTHYVSTAIELNVKTVYLHENKLTFAHDNTIYTINIQEQDPSIDYTEKRS